MIFVFGSNTGGIHGAGAAATAHKLHGAIWSKGFGHYGNSFAIPTKGVIAHNNRAIENKVGETLPMSEIRWYVHQFLVYSYNHPELTLQVTRIGCGLAGLKDEDIAPMFANASSNCQFDSKWQPILGDDHKYWGTF